MVRFLVLSTLLVFVSSPSVAEGNQGAGCACETLLDMKEKRLEERLLQRLMSFDKNGDGTLSVEEFRAGQKKLFIKHNEGWDRKLEEKEIDSLVEDVLGPAN